LFGSQVKGQVNPQKRQVESWFNPFLLQVKKFGFKLSIFQVRSANFNLFCHVYL